MIACPPEKILHLFRAFGVELEYMIVDKSTLNVLPITDQLLHAVLGEYIGDYEKEPIGWSNELALHVLELKTTTPTPDLTQIDKAFQKDVKEINSLLEQFGGRLMPTAMHPWMNPDKEMRLWTHDNSPIYAAFDRIFNCKGHGWSNLQSNHLNLPFGNEEEFVRLHAAIRVVLPLIPALAASSPIVEGEVTGFHDTRLHVYRSNSAKIPSITAHVIPEVCRSFQDYQTKILNRIYHDIAPYDPDHVLQYEWLNARGAITRFNRYAIEIRLVDVQECPQADAAISLAISEVVKHLVDEVWGPIELLHQFHEERLLEILTACIKDGEKAVISDREFLRVFGWAGGSCTGHDLWKHLMALCKLTDNDALLHIIRKGTLSTRILSALGNEFSHKDLFAVYQQLCQNLEEGTLFFP